jgi:hypothetical protein
MVCYTRFRIKIQPYFRFETATKTLPSLGFAMENGAALNLIFSTPPF